MTLIIGFILGLFAGRACQREHLSVWWPVAIVIAGYAIATLLARVAP